MTYVYDPEDLSQLSRNQPKKPVLAILIIPLESVLLQTASEIRGDLNVAPPKSERMNGQIDDRGTKIEANDREREEASRSKAD